jgi:acetyl esterase/lipase
MKNVKFASIFVFVMASLFVRAQSLPGFQEFTYKQFDTLALKLFVKNPDRFSKGKVYPTILFFFGGGWNSGKISQFQPHANYLASRGMIAVLVDYRVKTRHGTTPFDAVADAKSAIRYLRQNATLLCIDTGRIVASGGSAGGHLAAAIATVPGLNDPKDNLKISCVPNALVLFNPVFDNGPSGYGFERIGERYPELSPYHNLHKGTPPTVVFLGTKDDLIPVETAQRYKLKMEEAGCRCDLYLFEGQKHGFFNYREDNKEGNRYYLETVIKMDQFLESLGYIQGKPTINKGLK